MKSLIPPSLWRRFKSLLRRAREHGDLTHPHDKEVLLKFIVECHKCGTKLSVGEFERLLVANGVDLELAEELSVHYEFGRVLLCTHRHGTCYFLGENYYGFEIDEGLARWMLLKGSDPNDPGHPRTIAKRMKELQRWRPGQISVDGYQIGDKVIVYPSSDWFGSGHGEDGSVVEIKGGRLRVRFANPISFDGESAQSESWTTPNKIVHDPDIPKSDKKREV